MRNAGNNTENERASHVEKKEDALSYHMRNLHRISLYALSREYSRLTSYIDREYFHKKVFDDAFYKSTDDFIFRMDVTSLSYSQAFRMAYQDLQKEDYYSFLLGLKIIVVKLKGNQRYAYFDRDKIFELLNDMKTEYSVDHHFDPSFDTLEILTEECKDYLPIGFQKMTIEEYRHGSMRSLYDNYKKLDVKLLEEEFKAAVGQGNMYNYIVEIDHYINSNRNEITKNEWVFLAKLLSAQYATEKEPWSRDMTVDLLSVYLAIRDVCDEQTFEGTLYQLVTGTLKIIIKKISSSTDGLSSREIQKIINYLINVYTLNSNNYYLVYINNFLKMLDRCDVLPDLSSTRKWLEQHS